MPQLAPLSWALAPMIFWVLLLSLTASFWWYLNPNFPLFQVPSKTPFSPWNWQ